MWILCKPERVNFTQYEVGGVYEIPLELHNVSALSRRGAGAPEAAAAKPGMRGGRLTRLTRLDRRSSDIT